MANARFLMAGAIVVALAAPVLAQNLGVIKQRQTIMEGNGKAAKALVGYAKGETPYDAAAVAGLFAEMSSGAAKFGTLFPADSKTGGKTEASPAIWDKKGDWADAVAKFQADTKAAAAAKPATVEAFRAEFGKVMGNCKSCHESFRVKLQ
ncbi:MAG: cytochrome C554 [Alphaproteobacteria bacterium PA4]|nr:MAG: cytochrome C554 [Alphaproteobacteria bacterium PA4]